MSDMIERIIADAQRTFAGVIRFWEAKTEGWTESPIEQAFLLAFIANMQAHGLPWFVYSDHEEAKKAVLENHLSTFIIPQCQIEDYRVDFLIVTRQARRDPVEFIIECDGHDFHERTKEQATRDKSRDRRLQSLGYKVFRFTGSEIFRDPFGSVLDIYKHIEAVIDGRAS